MEGQRRVSGDLWWVLLGSGAPQTLMSEPHLLTSSQEGKELKEMVLGVGGKSAPKKYI